MRRTVIVRKKAEAAGIEVRCGETVLGTVGRLEGAVGEAEMMGGSLTHRPAFADHAEVLADLERAIAEGRDAKDLRADIEQRRIEVWHTGHDMRIDAPGTIEIAKGRVRFRANGAYLAMRTGGLG